MVEKYSSEKLKQERSSSLLWNFSCIFLFFFTCLQLRADKEYLNLKRSQIFLGPEWYYLKRTKDGGAKQQGNIIGIRVGYDQLKRYKWYWGGEALYARGTLNGHSGTENTLRSHFSDSSIEGRFGYTFQQKENYQIAFTPFIGVGYFVEHNHFVHPSPLPVHFKTYFPYGTAGFLSWIHLCTRFEMGCNIKIKFPYEPRCKISHDPDNEPMTQNIKEHPFYRIELPLTYHLFCHGHINGSFIPFFEYRKYGAHPNFPFNFIETQFKIWGITLEIQGRF